MSKELQIRNSTVDFLVFTRDAGEDGIEVRVQNGDIWLTQKVISQLFDVDRSVITKHLSNIFKEGELDENSVCAKFAQTADDGKTYNYKFYSLAAIIAQLLLLWGIELIQNGQRSSRHGQPKCWIHLQSRVMFLIKAD